MAVGLLTVVKAGDVSSVVVDRDVNFQALDRLCSDHESWLRASTTCARKAPMSVISTSSVSPGFIHSGGLRLWPTPSGVPVEMTSPGESAVKSEQKAMICGIE